ncbi:MAG TPA: metal ABC transporter substrate-binding protein [Ornithinimicrobium sp.]|uniref:metal ABC transporter substrate-binding protein n=1 Tax=Ornithinimicrobium sp. TaxID=1977084 RepID=UPI002B494192|nr:metal ABC transporter substrate-binding protein [Ornithinimicrobium sp.]HKJ12029.1 metal ABC transporter substrate-binding protein [Ornithinimicrobium sp.]
MFGRRRSLTAVALCSVLGVTACGSSSESSSESDSPTVLAAFYPLEFVASRVTGDPASVEVLTSPGVDPHDLELSPRAVGEVKNADLVIYSSGLQQAVDAAVEEQAGDHSLDVNGAADLVPVEAEGADEGDAQESAHEGEGAHEHEGEDDEHSEEEGHAHEDEGGLDPHFWLDPTRMVAVTEAVEERIAKVDPDNAETYAAHAEKLTGELEALQAEYDEGLARCRHEDMVTTHEAFGYIARAHDLHLISISGISPESEPGPARLAEVARTVERTQVPVIYTEVLLSRDIADTVAEETGTQVRLLDPLEGLTEESPGSDYLSVMRSNLETLRAGQECS